MNDVTDGWIMDLTLCFLFAGVNMPLVSSTVKFKRFAKAEDTKKDWRYGESNAGPPLC